MKVLQCCNAAIRIGIIFLMIWLWANLQAHQHINVHVFGISKCRNCSKFWFLPNYLNAFWFVYCFHLKIYLTISERNSTQLTNNLTTSWTSQQTLNKSQSKHDGLRAEDLWALLIPKGLRKIIIVNRFNIPQESSSQHIDQHPARKLREGLS